MLRQLQLFHQNSKVTPFVSFVPNVWIQTQVLVTACVMKTNAFRIWHGNLRVKLRHTHFLQQLFQLCIQCMASAMSAVVPVQINTDLRRPLKSRTRLHLMCVSVPQHFSVFLVNQPRKIFLCLHNSVCHFLSTRCFFLKSNDCLAYIGFVDFCQTRTIGCFCRADFKRLLHFYPLFPKFSRSL